MSDEPDSDTTKTHILRNDEFHRFLGLFQVGWSSLEMTTDFAIHNFLKVSPLQAHLITGGQTFGRKAKLLADLIGRSEHPNRDSLLAAFNALRADNKRDVFAHSYIWSDETHVKFIERPAGGNEATVKVHTFTLAEFKDHVGNFAKRLMKFYQELGCEQADLESFAHAAFSLDRRSTKSPGRPTSKS